ncbi:recombinase family protein [Adhaeribacter sp. BT258]|uniref:Recombinase family protein n=1 Tax=Adhaeribacter terrigena TaxID=2793070 RepID=A0ABS1BXG8_9BACT|nr:recombinase family protein [Adhaeribacter terrigena]MBK0401821.1 recombinase family protein [Adhaeribacter terrigena]
MDFSGSDKKKYVFYFRVSTKRQGESGLGLDAQRTYLNHFYSGKNVLAEFTDAVSGKSIDNRPQLLKALELCKKEKSILVVAKIDRLSRNTEQALSIYRDLEGRLESCDIPNLDKFTLTLFMAIADRERELISIRTKNALDEVIRRRNGKNWREASAAYKTGEASKSGILAIKAKALANANNKRAGALISEYRDKGFSWQIISDKLNDAGFKASKGGKFQAVQVQRIYYRIVEPV